jgi:hypothetical protein
MTPASPVTIGSTFPARPLVGLSRLLRIFLGGWYGGAGVVWLNAPSSDPAEMDPRYAYPPPDNSSANIAYEAAAGD